MGKSNFANDPFFKGSIDGFRIYDRVLSPEEANCLGNKINCKNINILLFNIIKGVCAPSSCLFIPKISIYIDCRR